jgi:hypothetical protein
MQRMMQRKDLISRDQIENDYLDELKRSIHPI